MDALKLRSTGFKYVNQLRPKTQKLQREKRRSKLRDLMVVRIMKSMRQAQLRQKRVQEISKGWRSNRDGAREPNAVPDIKVNKDLCSIILDREFEDIAKIEIDAFLNQGKILTDKNLKQIEKAIRERWVRTRMKPTQSQECYQTKSTHHLPHNLSHSSSRKAKEGSSFTPKVNDGNHNRSLMDNAYWNREKSKKRWGNMLSKKKDNIVSELNERLNNSVNPTQPLFKKSHNRYGGYGDADKYHIYNRVGASWEKLPKSKLEVLGNNDSRNNISNSIVVGKTLNKQVSPTKTWYNNKWIPRNKSNISLHDSKQDDLVEQVGDKSLVIKGIQSRGGNKGHLNRTLEDDQPYFGKERRSMNPSYKTPTIPHHNYSQHRIHKHDNESSTLSGLSVRDEWTEIELYNGILSKMRKDYEKQTKKDKIQEIRDTLKEQIIERNKVKKRELEEKQHYDKIVATSVKKDKRETDLIRMERQRKINQERALRDEQLFLEHKRKAMFAEEKRNYEGALVAKLQKEIKEEKDNAVQKRLKELTECRKLIKENELAKATMAEKKKKERADDAAALERYEKHLEEQDKKRAEEMKQRELRMQARMNKMKETVIDRQGKKEKEEELKLLKQVQERESREELKEKSDKIKADREIMHLREFLAQQVQEKKQAKQFEKEKNSMFIKQVLEKDDQDRDEEKEKTEKRKHLEEMNHKFLETQMEEKNRKQFGMSGEEFLINKKLLKEISDIKKQLKSNGKDVFDSKALKPF